MSKIDNENILNFKASLKNAADFVRLETASEVENNKPSKRAKIVSDFAMYNSCTCSIVNGKYYGNYRLAKSSNNRECSTKTVNTTGGIFDLDGHYLCGYAPVVECAIPSEEELQSIGNNFKDAKNIFSILKSIEPVVELGEYPQKFVNQNFARILEDLYNNGKIKQGLVSTGKTYTLNTNCDSSKFASKLCPEFEFQGKKYVRFHSNADVYINASSSRYTRPFWFEVNPVKFVVKNWNDMPKHCNPHAKNNANKMILQTKDILIGGLALNDYHGRHFDIFAFLKQSINEMLGNTKQVKKFEIPKTEFEVADYAFEGCTNLDEIVLHKKVTHVGKDAFAGCSFRYSYIDNESQNIVLSKKLPDKNKTYSNLVDFENLFSRIPGIDYETVINMYCNKARKDNANKINKLAFKLKKADITIPYKFMSLLRPMEIHQNFYESDFRFIKNEFPNLKEMLGGCSTSEQIAFWRFAYMFGCLSHEEFLDGNGKGTGVYIAQKASSALAKFFKKGNLSISKLYHLKTEEAILPFNKQLANDIIKFLSTQGENGIYENLELLLNFESKDKGSFYDILKCFETAKSMRNATQENGKVMAVNWKDVFLKLRMNVKYDNVSDDNSEIAKVFYEKGVKQKDFDDATKLFRIAKSKNIKNNILKKHLNETDLIKEIEKIKKETNKVLNDAANNLQNTFENLFTYEFLDKYDPRNAIIGLYCDCCATINSDFYGSDIVKYSIISRDVQNLVIKDFNNEIVAKAAMYVNRRYGYIVINDFEIAKKFKKNTVKTGYYSNDTGKTGMARQAIYDAIDRGIKQFVKEYDLEHPNNPIKQVNVGMGFNKLKMQCDKLKISEKLLKVPEDYGFADAEDEQRILYEKL